MCFTVTFPYKFILSLDHTQPGFHPLLPSFPRPLLFSPYLTFLLLFPGYFFLYCNILETIYTCVFIYLFRFMYLSSIQFPHRGSILLCSRIASFSPRGGFLQLCVPTLTHLSMWVPPHNCGIWIFIWIQLGCLLSNCNIYADPGCMCLLLRHRILHAYHRKWPLVGA